MENTREIEDMDALELRELFASTPKSHPHFHRILRALDRAGISIRDALQGRSSDRMAVGCDADGSGGTVTATTFYDLVIVPSGLFEEAKAIHTRPDAVADYMIGRLQDQYGHEPWWGGIEEEVYEQIIAGLI